MISDEKIYFYKTPIGKLGIIEKQNKIVKIIFENEKIDRKITLEETPLIKLTYNQLTEYFEGKRKLFDIPIDISEGTAFQQMVWRALIKIPYGETKSYLAIASQIGNSKACRAVGNANKNNPIPIIIPCHRIIGNNGSLSGYAGGISIKKYLLDLEKVKTNK